jgi:acyl carrier protein
MDLFMTIRKIIARELTVDAETVVREARFRDDLGADSLELLNLIQAVEDRFEVHLPQEELGAVETVGDFVRLVESKAGGAA